jgi:CRISPR-associated protein Csd2
MSNAITNRYDFVLYFDVVNGNPNGDPDAGNMPRIDPETNLGIVSDVCLKRKVRNYVDLVMAEPFDAADTPESQQGYKIYVQDKAILNERNERAYIHCGLKPSKSLPKAEAEANAVTQFMCDNFYDIRTFGAVMSTGVNCGQVRGPVQICFARSVEPVVPQELSITRIATAKEGDSSTGHTMGRKQYIPYGLYRVEGFVSASLAEKTGFSEEDLELLWEALLNMFETDRSAARGLMTARRLYVFKHEGKLGNAPASALFDAISAVRTTEGPARSFADYELKVATDSLPVGVELQEKEWIAPRA